MKKLKITFLLAVAFNIALIAQGENPLRFDFRKAEYVYTLAADSLQKYTQPFNNNWWWNDNTKAAKPAVVNGVLQVSIGARSTVAKDDLANEFGSLNGIAITTPQVLMNTEDFPLFAVKFTKLPEMADGYSVFRYQQIVRKESTPDKANHDWYFKIDPAGSLDSYYCTHLEDEDGGTILVFDLSKSARNHRWTLKNEALAQPAENQKSHYQTMYSAAADGKIGTASSMIPVGKMIRSDVTFVWEGVKDTTQKAEISWMRGFSKIEDVYNYAWPENDSNKISLDYRSGDYLFTLAADSLAKNYQPFANNWWWNDNTKAKVPFVANHELNISIGARATAAKDDLANVFSSVNGITITTPQVLLNTEEFPLMAVKFNKLPEMADGYTLFRYQQIVRKESTPDKANHDWFFKIDPAASADVSYCTQLEDEDGAMIYVFDLSKSAKVHRWTLKNEALAQPAETQKEYYMNLYAAAAEGKIGTATSIIPVGKMIRSDVTFMWEGVKDTLQTASMSWLKSFKTIEDVYAFAWGDGTDVKKVEPNALKVIGLNNQITIRDIEGASTVQVFNISGQLIDNRRNEGTVYQLTTGKGIYLVRVTGQNSPTRTAKVLVH